MTESSSKPAPGFFRRLSYYLMGLAIGCTVLGFFKLASRQEAKVQEQRAKQIQNAPPPKDNLFPPIPKDDGAGSKDSPKDAAAPAPTPPPAPTPEKPAR